MSTYAYMCPTPKEHCKGSIAKLSASLEKQGLKKHGTSKDAMNCYCAYLVNVLGCTKISAREYKHPNGPIEVLSRQNKFGVRLRAGKGDDKGSMKAIRGMPPVRGGGIIVGS